MLFFLILYLFFSGTWTNSQDLYTWNTKIGELMFNVRFVKPELSFVTKLNHWAQIFAWNKYSTIQVPLYVATEMASRVASVSRASLFVPSADDYVKAAIRQIGYEPRCTPYWAHSLQWCFARLLPEAVLDAWRLSIGLQRRSNGSVAMEGTEGCKQEWKVTNYTI